MKDKKGLTFAFSTVAGKSIVSPTDIAKNFSEERSHTKKQLDFVYFLDGNEKLQKSFPKNEKSFLPTWKREKYSFLLE